MRVKVNQEKNMDIFITPDIFKALLREHVFGQNEIEWVKDRPPVILDLMVKYPPLCLVKVKPEFVCEIHKDKPEYFVVQSYFENGMIGLSPKIDGSDRVYVRPECFELLEYCGDFTPAYIEELISAPKTS